MRPTVSVLLLTAVLLGGLLTCGIPAGAVAAAPTEAPAGVPSPADTGAIGAVFDAAQRAVQKRDGAAVVALLSRASTARLEAVRTAAHSGTSAPLDRLPPAERLAALSLRRSLSPAEIRRGSLGEFAGRAFAKGPVDAGLARRAKLGPVRVAGDRATALLLVDGRPSMVQADFVREAAGWRIDLTPALSVANTLLRTVAALNGKSEAAVVDEMLAKVPARTAPAGSH